MNINIPTGLHILAWQKDNGLFMEMSGEAGILDIGDITAAFGPPVCPANAPIIMDISSLDLSKNPDVVSEIVRTVRQAAARVSIFGHGKHNEVLTTNAVSAFMLKSWEKPEEKPFWQTHCYQLPAENWVSCFIRDYATTMALNAGFSRKISDDIRIAVGEAVTNAIRHGCITQETGQIRFTCVISRDMIEFRIHDNGYGFDFDTTIQSKRCSGSWGGYGLGIISDVMDEVEFKFECGTLVKLVKYLKTGDTDNA